MCKRVLRVGRTSSLLWSYSYLKTSIDHSGSTISTIACNLAVRLTRRSEVGPWGFSVSLNRIRHRTNLTTNLAGHITRLRGDPRLLRVPPYISLLCMLGGVIWILLLPLNQYSRRTYISENALLPGQVHTYFGGSEQNVFRAYRHEVAGVIVPPWTHDANGTRIQLELKSTQEERTAKIQDLFRNAGLKTASQKYRYTSSGHVYEGENVYAILHAPRGDGTEAVVLTAAIRNIEDGLNLNGVTLLISLARYFKRWSLWSKDIIFLVTPDSKAGTQAWVDAYHSQHNPADVADLSPEVWRLAGRCEHRLPL